MRPYSTAPERLRTPPQGHSAGGAGGGGLGETRASPRASRSGGGDPRNGNPAVDAWVPGEGDAQGLAGGQRGGGR